MFVSPETQVYANLEPQAYFLQLADGGAGLVGVWDALAKLEEGISVLNVYYAINGISILLLIARWDSACPMWRSAGYVHVCEQPSWPGQFLLR